MEYGDFAAPSKPLLQPFSEPTPLQYTSRANPALLKKQDSFRPSPSAFQWQHSAAPPLLQPRPATITAHAPLPPKPTLMPRPVGRIENPGDRAERVLVIKLSALGDFVLAMGAMKIIREQHPSAHITLLTTPMFKEFAAACPYFNRVEIDGRPKDVKGTTTLLRRLRGANYDIAYDFQTSGRTQNYAKALGGSTLWSGNVKGAVFEHLTPHRDSLHTIERLAEQLTFAGIGPMGGWPKEALPLADFSWIRPALRDPPRLSPRFYSLNDPYALIIPGASEAHEDKRWPMQNYCELGSWIADQGITPVIIGTRSEAEVGQAMAKADNRVKNIITRTDLFQIITLAQEAVFAVGNDTGPMHMSTLAGAPGVALFATNQSKPDRARPRGSSVITVEAPSLEEVTTRDVIQAITSLNLF